MSYRDEAIDRLDFTAFLSSQGVAVGPRVGNDEWRFLCPFHDDREPSANFNAGTKLWKCQACGKGGTAIDWLMLQGRDFKEALTEVGALSGMEPPTARRTNGAVAHAVPATTVTKGKLTEANVKAWHEAALRNTELMGWFTEKRGYTPETLDRFELGWDGSRVTIPVRDEQGALVNVRRYLRDSTSTSGKMLPLMAGAGPDVTTRLYPGAPLPGEVLLVEGEWDAIAAWQAGLEMARTVTIGAGNWNPTWTPLFADKVVTICYDNDDAGRKGAPRVAAILANVASSVRILQIPNLPPKGDITDFFVEQQRSVDELRVLINEATPYVVAPAQEEGPAIRLPLHLASDAKHRNQRLELAVLLAGKAMTPYTVPYEFRVHCDMNNKRLCSMCPMQEIGGDRMVTLAPSDPSVLSLIGVPLETQSKALKALAKALPQCNRPLVEIEKAINIEELRLIPELDTAQDAGDTEYVARSGFFMGHGLLPNRGYTMTGYAHPHPKTQATVHLLSEAEPAQDNISAFALTPELRDQLGIFRATNVAARFADIYDDLRGSVHRIQDRLDMQIAYDLTWHSVIAFYFNGAFVRRGWVETMVMSDSGQGKTEMAVELLRHYRLGERIGGEKTSGAGLVGGLEKMGDTWLLSWGRIPLNDKRLLIVDETQGVAASQIEEMSDIRATGIAEITKIRTERTNARCRIVWLANPATGQTISQHNQGVLAIKDLFKKPEDIRRLDFALTLASGDVDYARAINVHHDVAGTPRYSSDACRTLILWAWSRRPDQVEFTPAATTAILEGATDMGHRFHASIPLVEPSDQRLKLARLAAAAAARVYSTDETGERLIVDREHVEFVVDFLERVYGAPSMAYDEYSRAMYRGEQLSEGESSVIRSEIEGWGESMDAAIDLLRTSAIFRKTDLTDVVGWDPDYARGQLKMLSSHRLIRPTREGYRKTAAFIVLLRGLTGKAVVGEKADDEPF